MTLDKLLDQRRDLWRRMRRGEDIKAELRDVERGIRRLDGDKSPTRKRVRRRAISQTAAYSEAVSGDGAWMKPKERVVELKRRAMTASVVRALTGSAVNAAKVRGDDPTEIALLRVAYETADREVKLRQKVLNDVKDILARTDLHVPNLEQSTSPELHPVTDYESCSKCGKHKNPSCGPTVFASLLGTTINAAMEWMEEINGKPLKRKRDHTAMTPRSLTLRCAHEAGFHTETIDINPPVRFGDMLRTVLANDGDVATYIVHVPNHVLLLWTHGDGSFTLLDSGYMFSREGTTCTNPAQVKTRRTVQRLVRVMDEGPIK